MAHPRTATAADCRVHGPRHRIGIALAAALALIAATVGSVPGGLQAAELRLRSSCDVATALVVLADVAEIAAADQATADRLARMELFPAPAAGQQRVVPFRELQDLLVLRGVNLAEHRFTGAAQTVVRAAAAPAAASAAPAVSLAAARQAERLVARAVVEALRAAGQPIAEDRIACPVEPSAAALFTQRGARLRVLAFDAATTVAMASSSAAETPAYVARIQVVTASGTREAAVEVRIRPAETVVAVARALPRGARIQPGDVILTAADVPAGTAVFRTVEEAIGKQTTQAIAEGKVLQADYVQAPLLVRRGDIVTIYATSGAVRVRTTARARDEGAAGEVVSVEALHDRQPMFARVVGPREVEILARAVQSEAAP